MSVDEIECFSHYCLSSQEENGTFFNYENNTYLNRESLTVRMENFKLFSNNR